MRHILLIQLRQLGDILLTTPCIREIKREMPRTRITFLCHSMGKLILEHNPYLDEFYTYSQADSVWREWQMMQAMRTKQYDLVIDFMYNPRSALYTWFTRSPVRVAFDSRRRMAYTQLVPRAQDSDYIVREKFKLLDSAGFQPRDESLTLPWFEKHTAPLMAMIGQHEKFRQAPLRVVMAPTHRRELRQWPKSAFAALADLLVERWQAEVVWVWGPGEESFIDEVMRFCQKPTLKAPVTTFREMAALVANCDLMVANSNGPSHVAVAADICSFQLHGPTSLKAWCPLSNRHRGLQSSTGVIADLSVDAVFQALEDFRATVLAQAEERRRSGVRLKWNTLRQ